VLSAAASDPCSRQPSSSHMLNTNRGSVEGLYVDQSSGLAILVETQREQGLSVKVLDRRADPAQISPDGDRLDLVESCEALDIAVDQGVSGSVAALVVREGATSPVQCARVQLLPADPHLVEPLCGWWYCSDMQAFVRCVLTEMGFELVLGSQTEALSRLLLSWCGGSMFYSDGTTVRFVSEPNGEVQMLVSRALCRDLLFTRRID
jgi:hypothetical protein